MTTKTPGPFIDGHTHVGNVGFIPVDGVLRVWHVPKLLAETVAYVCNHELERKKPGSANLEAVERERLDLMEWLQVQLRADQTPRRFEAARRTEEPDIIAGFVQLVPDADIRALGDQLTKVVPLLTRLGDTARGITALRQRHLGKRDPDELRRILDWLLRTVSSVSPRGLVDWLLLMVMHESRIVAAFDDAWHPRALFDWRVHLMIDMELHYYGTPAYSITEQIDRMIDVVAGATPPLAGLVGFDPFREKSLEIVQGALSRGFIGVKFYPPSGYKPAENQEYDLDDDLLDDKHLEITASDVNARCGALFDFCGETIPIISHCSDGGMKAGPETGAFSHPRYWQVALESGHGKLRLCLAHAGGQEGWTAPLTSEGDATWNDSWAPQVVDLCLRYDNVYCDFGYFDDILNDAASTVSFQQRLAGLIARSPAFVEKCCYGSDWHLIVIKRYAPEYPDRFAKLLADAKLSVTQIDLIMRGNAKQFLKLP
jgi:hypothetical protein